MTATTDPDPRTLRALLDGEHADQRDRVREWLSRPGNASSKEKEKATFEPVKWEVKDVKNQTALTVDAFKGAEIQYLNSAP